MTNPLEGTTPSQLHICTCGDACTPIPFEDHCTFEEELGRVRGEVQKALDSLAFAAPEMQYLHLERIREAIGENTPSSD